MARPAARAPVTAGERSRGPEPRPRGEDRHAHHERDVSVQRSDISAAAHESRPRIGRSVEHGEEAVAVAALFQHHAVVGLDRAAKVGRAPHRAVHLARFGARAWVDSTTSVIQELTTPSAAHPHPMVSSVDLRRSGGETKPLSVPLATVPVVVDVFTRRKKWTCTRAEVQRVVAAPSRSRRCRARAPGPPSLVCGIVEVELARASSRVMRRLAWSASTTSDRPT